MVSMKPCVFSEAASWQVKFEEKGRSFFVNHRVVRLLEKDDFFAKMPIRPNEIVCSSGRSLNSNTRLMNQCLHCLH